MLAVRGAGSRIVHELRPLLPAGECVLGIGRDEPMPLTAERYLFCGGLLLGANKPTPGELHATYEANYGSVRRECDRILEQHHEARICVLGSESGFSGSFDVGYAAAKRDLHEYVERKKIGPRQQFVCIAPSIIADAGMTMRRTDGDVLIRKCRAHPKRRFLTSREVAQAVHFALYVDQGYLTGVVVRMNGGQHTVC